MPIRTKPEHLRAIRTHAMGAVYAMDGVACLTVLPEHVREIRRRLELALRLTEPLADMVGPTPAELDEWTDYDGAADADGDFDPFNRNL